MGEVFDNSAQNSWLHIFVIEIEFPVESTAPRALAAEPQGPAWPRIFWDWQVFDLQHFASNSTKHYVHKPISHVLMLFAEFSPYISQTRSPGSPLTSGIQSSYRRFD